MVLIIRITKNGNWDDDDRDVDYWDDDYWDDGWWLRWWLIGLIVELP